MDGPQGADVAVLVLPAGREAEGRRETHVRRADGPPQGCTLPQNGTEVPDFVTSPPGGPKTYDERCCSEAD